MGRPLEFDKEAALDKAIDVFWRHGYEAASLSELLDAMEISKSSFYQAFSSKHKLFQRCLSRYRNQVTRSLLKQLQSAPSALEFLQRIFEDVVASANTERGQKGCLLMNTATEFAQRDQAVAFLIKDGISQLEDVFVAAVEQAKNEGKAPKEKSARSLAQYLISSISGLRTLVKSGLSKQELAAVAETALSPFAALEATNR